MNKYDEDLIYSYIIDGVSQRALASKMNCSENMIKSTIKDSGFNRGRYDDSWEGTDFKPWRYLNTKAGFTEREIRGFISDYSDNYSGNPDFTFELYLQKKFNEINVRGLPKNYADKWRVNHTGNLPYRTNNSMSGSDIDGSPSILSWGSDSWCEPSESHKKQHSAPSFGILGIIAVIFVVIIVIYIVRHISGIIKTILIIFIGIPALIIFALGVILGIAEWIEGRFD